MKSTTYAIAGALALIALAASFNIDNSYINALHWVLAGAGLLCLMGIMLYWAADVWEQICEVLEYRTANGFCIESQTRKLQADASRGLPAPRHQLPPFKPGPTRQPAAVTSLDKGYMAVLAQAKASGEAAGLLQAQGGPVAVNPHKPGSRAYIVWLTSCEAVLEAKAAADAHQAHNQRTAA